MEVEGSLVRGVGENLVNILRADLVEEEDKSLRAIIKRQTNRYINNKKYLDSFYFQLDCNIKLSNAFRIVLEGNTSFESWMT